MKLCSVSSVEAWKASIGVVAISSICPVWSLSCKVSVLASINYNFGQLHSGSHMNFGPVNHLDLLLNSDSGIPRVLSSTGFRVPGQWFHWLAWVLSKNSATQWATKTCCRLSDTCIHWSAVVLSVHICVELMSILCSLRMNFVRRAPKTAACSSILVI